MSTSEKESKTKQDEKPALTLPATVEKIVPTHNPAKPEMAEIHIDGADHLYKEIRVENKLINESGEEVKLKPGAHVDVTIEADPTQTIPKSKTAKSKS